MEYDNLGEDEAIKNKLINFRQSIKKIENMLELVTKSEFYNELDLTGKVNHDLFMAYTLNTLYWLYLRSKNEDPTKNDVKNQLSRIKEYMVKRDQVSTQNSLFMCFLTLFILGYPKENY